MSGHDPDTCSDCKALRKPATMVGLVREMIVVADTIDAALVKYRDKMSLYTRLNEDGGSFIDALPAFRAMRGAGAAAVEVGEGELKARRIMRSLAKLLDDEVTT